MGGPPGGHACALGWQDCDLLGRSALYTHAARCLWTRISATMVNANGGMWSTVWRVVRSLSLRRGVPDSCRRP